MRKHLTPDPLPRHPVHTMAELRMTGNCLKGSRPILSFDGDFESTPMLKLAKEMLSQAFNVPNKHPKSKPFFDHIITFSHFDGRIWFRNFQVSALQLLLPPSSIVHRHSCGPGRSLQIVWPDKKKLDSKMELAEIGPRFVLQPIRVFSGSFHGSTLFENGAYISPNRVRTDSLTCTQAHRPTISHSPSPHTLTRSLAHSPRPTDPIAAASGTSRKVQEASRGEEPDHHAQAQHQAASRRSRHGLPSEVILILD